MMDAFFYLWLLRFAYLYVVISNNRKHIKRHTSVYALCALFLCVFIKKSRCATRKPATLSEYESSYNTVDFLAMSFGSVINV